MTIIQNVACIQATLNPEDKRISLNKDILRGKKILALYLFSSTEDVVLKSPYVDEYITQLMEIEPVSMYLNLTDNKGVNFVKDYALSNFVIQSELDSFMEYPINRVLDVDRCYITYKGTSVSPIKLLIYIFYQTHNFDRFTDEVSGSITVQLPLTSDFQNIQLSTLVNQSLKNKQIKKILASGRCYGYLDLYCKNNRLENLPAHLFEIHSSKEFYLDNIEIDFEKSFYRHRGSFASLSQLTFIY